MLSDEELLMRVTNTHQSEIFVFEGKIGLKRVYQVKKSSQPRWYTLKLSNGARPQASSKEDHAYKIRIAIAVKHDLESEDSSYQSPPSTLYSETSLPSPSSSPGSSRSNCTLRPRPPPPPPQQTSSLNDLTGQIHVEDRYPSVNGGFSDIWQGRWQPTELAVAIKVIRLNKATEESEKLSVVRKRLQKEIDIWKSLRHPNVAQLLGISQDYGPLPAMISRWFVKGNAKQFANDPNNPVDLFRKLEILLDTAKGLAYLHSKSVVHGDLKAANIVIQDNGKAAIIDFGLSKIRIDEASVASITVTESPGFTARWLAPEYAAALSQDKSFTPTSSADIWSYGAFMIEILANLPPFSKISMEPAIFKALADGQAPQFPDDAPVHPQLRRIRSQCCCVDADKRTTAKDLVTDLKRLRRRRSILLEGDCDSDSLIDQIA
ncbi:kinase-like protein [Sistotremastrum niveocremeum HHB9708]|uniref:Kinase-like protein n=1 Tax=Sistotremastrum niveocremeum HHB9708 TaxID=1314777 RepID=A0A164XBH9_9AGAM|nr:kinase-like protein [Sistotremastrum niveocremeum HHB9708]